MISIFREFKDVKKNINKSIVAIGNFDGLHLGHKAVLNQAKFIKKKNGGKLIILTFYPHPLKILRPGNRNRYTTSAAFQYKFFKIYTI
ncbi:MAG TPA: hypothetical protein EYQ51_01495 [Alphaproteobacteria bacterium]|nr:hypothetical protein [Alphaproteobacteria bacterium]